jgi:hypothetical protein
MSDFDLRTFVRGVFHSSTATDPKALAKETLARLSPEDERAALEQAMPLVAQNFLSSARGSLTSLGGAHVNRGAHLASGATEGIPTPTADSARSWKTKASREYWRERLEDPFCAGPDGTWLPLGDCDVPAFARIKERADMLVAANQRTSRGADEWIELLVEHGVTRARDLPEAVLRHRLQGGAAA